MELDSSDQWTLHVDGASRQTGAGLGLQLKSPTGEVIERAIRLDFLVSNNEAEYKAIISGINLVIFVSQKKIIIRSDSQLVVGQVNGEYETRDQRMTKYVNLVTLRLGKFMAWRLEHVSRDSNEKADTLEVVVVSLLIKATVLLPIYYQQESSITMNRVNEVDKACPSWMTPIVHYLSSGELPDDMAKAHKTQVQAARFSLVNDQLYKWSLDEP